ncbi:hypothetical protein HX005_10260 [Acinetobacter sp. R933-2]|nr:hypothetical protein [Acinetobacter sp. R933-2]MDM1247771.1 hypothetical protein [Acinetobacter sp. R933-2]
MVLISHIVDLRDYLQAYAPWNRAISNIMLTLAWLKQKYIKGIKQC